MADIRQLSKLMAAIGARDFQRAEELAREVADREERAGHHAAAQRLRGALRPNGQAAHPAPAPAFVASVVGSALSQVASECGLESVFLSRVARSQLEEVVQEWRRRQQLVHRGLRRRSKLLLHGPPGCGKSLTGRALGRELGLPVFVVRFDAVIGAYLGQTALNLRHLFRHAEAVPSILLLDEVDALGKRRGNPLDVGELDRVVISLMQELEHTEPSGLVIATSNLPGQLDDALWRRFDLVVHFPRPNVKALRAFLERRAIGRQMALPPKLRAAASKMKSYAEAERALEAEARRLALAEPGND